MRRYISSKVDASAFFVPVLVRDAAVAFAVPGGYSVRYQHHKVLKNRNIVDKSKIIRIFAAPKNGR